MLAKSFPKVSLESRLSRESYDAKFGMDECARNNYSHLKFDFSQRLLLPEFFVSQIAGHENISFKCHFLELQVYKAQACQLFT